jgi:protein tyrosine phosphatase
VKLAGAGKDTYINANYIHSPLGLDRKLIAAQGPKDNTVDHFWRMIYE